MRGGGVAHLPTPLKAAVECERASCGERETPLLNIKLPPAVTTLPNITNTINVASDAASTFHHLPHRRRLTTNDATQPLTMDANDNDNKNVKSNSHQTTKEETASPPMLPTATVKRKKSRLPWGFQCHPQTINSPPATKPLSSSLSSITILFFHEQ